MRNPFGILGEPRGPSLGPVRYAPTVDEGAFGGGDNAAGVSRSGSRLLFLMVFAALLIIVGRAGWMQIGQAAWYRSQAEDNRSRIEPIPAERGSISDRNGTPLTRNVPDFGASVTPADLPDDASERRAVILRIADLLEIQPEEIESRLEEYRTIPGAAVPVAQGITQEQAVRIGVESSRLPSLHLVHGTRRDYPLSASAPSLSHLLGYEGRVGKEDLAGENSLGYVPTDTLGKAGLEKAYEADLRGTYGRRRVEIDARGVARSVIAEEPSTAGKDLTLSLDAELQQAIESSLGRALKEAGQRRASAIAMDPDTGEILALVSLPGFDNNLFSKGISAKEYQSLAEDDDRPLFPRAVAGLLPSGSTFKLAVAAAALEEGLVTPSTLVRSSGGIQVGQWFFPDWKAGGHGLTSVRKALAESVNTFFYAVGGGHEDIVGLGVSRINAYAKKFGLGSPLGIDLPGEAAGFLPTEEWKRRQKGEQWYIGDTYHLAIGQGDLLVTPLQVAAMTAVVANGGTLVRPHLVRSIRRADSASIDLPNDPIARNVISPSTAHEVAAGMRQTVTEGSARGQLGLLPVAAAAKTGTAQWRTGRQPHAWITAFAPYDEPEIVLAIVIEEGGEGSNLPQRVAREALDWYFGDRSQPPAPPIDAAAAGQ